MDVEQEIRRRIRASGRITFAEYMDLALFWPAGGYYTNPDNIGPQGDFYTAPGAHPAFGALLCLQAFQMWQLLGRPSTFWLVELGAGHSPLAHDFVDYSAHLPQKFGDSLRYVCLDRVSSGASTSGPPEDVARKVERLIAGNVPLLGMVGCLLSNELIDSFPVHRVVVQNGVLKEVYVSMADGDLVEVLDRPSTPALEERLDGLGVALADGSAAEINLAMNPWVMDVASALEHGFVLTIDYGHEAEALYSQQRRNGTLSCAYKHAQTGNPYQRIGRQDMTSQVDFTSLMEAGTDCGLELVGFGTQREYFRNLGLHRLTGLLTAAGLKQRETDANRLGMLDIVRPGGMGEFKVMVQGKRVGTPQLWGFDPSPDLDRVLDGLPVPLLSQRHMPLLEGRYPRQGFEWEELWPE